MRVLLPLILSTGLLMGMASWAQGDNYLKNTDFKEGSQLWHGDGQEAYLKADGTEGTEDDAGAIPVLRVALSKGQRRSIYQEFKVGDAPASLHVSVEVYASVDFKRSSHASDYQTGDYMPNADFVIRLLPDYFDRPGELKPGEWAMVQGTWRFPTAATDRVIYFTVPPGDGVIYIKNPSVTP